MVAPSHLVISGYYGFANTGDEAVLAALISGLRQRNPDIRITVLSADPEATSRQYDVNAVLRTDTHAIGLLFRNSDLLISGGGSLIQDATSFRSLAYYLWIIHAAKSAGCRAIILGQGIGPLRRTISRIVTKKVLNGVDLIAVRDSASAELLCNIGVCIPPITVTADPTLTLAPASAEEACGLLEQAGIQNGESVIALALRNWPESPKIEDALSHAIRRIEKSVPARLLLISMHTPDDSDLSKRLAMGTNAAVQPEPWSPQQVMGVIAQCDLVVGMRLHSLIFGAAVGTPSLGISYDPKVESFQLATGQEIIDLNQLKSGELPDAVLRAWKRRGELNDALDNAVPPMREAAERNFELALGGTGVAGVNGVKGEGFPESPTPPAPRTPPTPQ